MARTPRINERPTRADTPRLGFPVRREIAELLAELQDAVRRAGHHRPSQSLLVSALLLAASGDGEELEKKVIAPYRRAFPEDDQ